MMTRWKMTKKLIPIIALFAMIFAGCSAFDPGPLNPKGPVGQDQYKLILLSSGIMFFVLVVVFVLFFYAIIRFRKRPGQTGYPKQVEGSTKLEIIWTVIPVILLFILAVPTVAMTFNQAKVYSEDDGALQVKVTAHQFWWQFEYKDYNIHTAQELVIPVDKKIQFELVAADVNHSFWVPELGGKMDHTAGVTNRFFLEASEEGLYRGRCAELCGEAHALMYFSVKAVSAEEFDAWVENMKQPTTIPPELEKAHEIFKANCISCHAIDSSEPSPAGPNLKGFANREYLASFLFNEEEDLRRWLADPQKVKPGNKMFIKKLSDEEIDELVNYLYNLD